jgi:hypothetical protein
MCKFLKRKRVIKECDSSAGDTDNSMVSVLKNHKLLTNFTTIVQQRVKARSVSTIKATY